MAAVETAERHLLVVDDDDRIRDLLKQYLTRHGFRVTTAPGGAHARSLIETIDFDLAVFDLDGTLADSFAFFVTCHNRLARRHRFRPVAGHEMEMLRGWNPRRIMRHTGLPAWRLPWVARDFRPVAWDEAARAVLRALEEPAVTPA